MGSLKVGNKAARELNVIQRMGVDMKARNIFGQVLLAAALAASGPAMAAAPAAVATLSQAEGTVMVDRGQGFVTLKAGDTLFKNDRIITLKGSTAQITFAEGCQTSLKPNNLIVISDCKASIVDGTQGAPAIPAAGLTGPALAAAVIGGVAVTYAVYKATTNEEKKSGD